MSVETTKKQIIRRLNEADRRRFRRIIHSAIVKCMWPNGHEFEAHTVDIGGGGLSIATEEPFELDAPLIMYVEELGRLTGHVARKTATGFAVNFDVTAYKIEKIIDQLTWIVNKDRLSLQDDRKGVRRTAAGQVIAIYENGVTAQCNVIDISLQGVALRTTAPRPEIGMLVRIGKKQGKCARYVDGGFAVEFALS